MGERDATNPISTERWVDHFKGLLKKHEITESDQDIITELAELERQKIFDDLSFKIGAQEIECAINELKVGKAAGPDGINAEIIKASCPLIIRNITDLFNHILTTGSYPQSWGVGLITSIHKKGCPSDPNNYRGITVSNCLAKLFGLVLCKRLTKFCNEKSLIDERQSSHRKKTRTTDNIFVLKALFDKYCTKEGKQLYACFIDFKKAFDTVWHDALFLQLRRAGIGGPFYNILKGMYKKTRSAVKYDSHASEEFEVHRGVRQGDVLSPLLFNLFVNDLIPILHEEDCAPPKLINSNVGCLLYADDLVILSTSPIGLQNSIDKLSTYCSKWKLEINLSKSKVMNMNRTGKKKCYNFSFKNRTMESVTSYTYLGIVLTNNGSFKAAQNNLHEKALRALFKLKSMLSGTTIGAHASLKLFDSLVKPVALYGSELWGVDCLSYKNRALWIHYQNPYVKT